MKVFWGKVRKGKQRGKKLGFPTANLNLHKAVPEGIYISRTRVDKMWLPSLTFIGFAKTFNETKLQAETYILDFNQSLYEKVISIKLLKKIRNNKKFSSPDELVREMKIDKGEAEKYFSAH